MHCMPWYTGTYGITAMGLLYRLDDMVKFVCIIWAIKGDHYWTYIISGVGRPKSELTVLLVLSTVAYNIRGTGVLLQVLQDCANLAGKG